MKKSMSRNLAICFVSALAMSLSAFADKPNEKTTAHLVFHEEYCDGAYGECHDAYRDAGSINPSIQESGSYYVVTESSGEARCEIRKAMVDALGMDATQFQTLLSLPSLEVQCNVWSGQPKIKDFFDGNSDSIDTKSEMPKIQSGEPVNDIEFGLNTGPVQTDYSCSVPGVGCGHVITFGPRTTALSVLYTVATLNVTGESKAVSAYINIGTAVVDVKTLNNAGWTVLEVLDTLSKGNTLSCNDDKCSKIINTLK